MRKVFRDPVHNLIAFSGDDCDLIVDIIDQPEFQRLRRIRQLGLGYLVYPGAEHSRWVHSLGVCHIARRMLDALKESHGESCPKYSPLHSLRREILAAALLHDVGHGPFSHGFERAFPPPKDVPDDYPKDHEGWSCRIIKEYFSETLEKHDVNVDVTTALIDKNNRKNLLAKDIISSQLDADRMDYLLRDSLATGTKYGEFDLEWMLHSLRVGKIEEEGRKDNMLRLCFQHGKAIHIIENYILARASMYSQVYIHRTTRAYEALLNNIFALAKHITRRDVNKAPQPCSPAFAKLLTDIPLETNEYLVLDDFRLWSSLIDWAKSSEFDGDDHLQLQRMCRKLVHRQQPYKAIELMGREKQDKALEWTIEHKDKPWRFSFKRDTYSDVAYRGVNIGPISQRDEDKLEEQEDREIRLITKDDKVLSLESESPRIRAIAGIVDETYRLYYDDEDIELVKKLNDDGWLKD